MLTPLIGSWDGHIRIWKLDTNSTNQSASQIRSFSPLRTISVPGVVNSLQLIRSPAGSLASASWLTSAAVDSSNSNSEKIQDIILIAGVGQEPRLGRWIQLKGNEDGAKNATYVFALTRTSTSTSTSTSTVKTSIDVESGNADDMEE